MQRSRLRNIINKSKELSQKVGDPYDLFVDSLPELLDYYKDGGKYRLRAAWEAYGKPKDYQEAIWEGLVENVKGSLVMPSIGYNEQEDAYEYLNTGKENDTVAKDIRAWDNDVIPFIKELKAGGYIRTFNDEKNCWTYSRGKKDLLGEINKFQIGGLTSYKESPLQLIELIKNSNANFAKRLLDPNRKHIPLKEGGWGNFKLSWSEDEQGVIVYPEILEINGELVDLSYDRDKAWESAIKRGDYIVFPSREAADWFTKNYKKYYKGFDKNPESFKNGGQMNVIPEGALHARKNNMDLAAGGEVTHKGIPVVDNEGNLQAEIEKNEIIFTKDVTDNLEQWYKKFYDEDTSQKEKDEIAIKAGKFLCKEIIENTDDRTGLIEKVLEQ